MKIEMIIFKFLKRISTKSMDRVQLSSRDFFRFIFQLSRNLRLDG